VAGFAFFRSVSAALQRNEWASLNSLAEERHLLPRLQASVSRIRESESLEVVSNGGSECVLSGIYLYEIFLVSDKLVRQRGTGTVKPE